LISCDRITPIDGFSIASRSSQTLVPSSSVASIRSVHPRFSAQQRRLPLLSSKSHEHSDSRNRSPSRPRVLLRSLFQRLSIRFPTRLVRFSSKLRQSVLVLCAAFLFSFGVADVENAHASTTPTASTTTTAVQVSRNILSPSLDQMVDNYVKEHMFDDDTYDPVESIYREAMDDKLQGTHPKALKEITSSVLGKDAAKAEKQASSTGIGGTLVNIVEFFRQRGLSEMQAIALVTGTLVVGTPAIFFMVVMTLNLQGRRSVNKLMKKRYGDTYTVDATIKVEEDVELPDDDEDDDDDDDDDDEDDEKDDD